MSRSFRSGLLTAFLAFFLAIPRGTFLVSAQNTNSTQEGEVTALSAISITVPSTGISIDFGTPIRFDSVKGLYMGTGVQIPSKTLYVPASGEGALLFYQQEGLLASGFPRSRDNMIALAHEGGFVSVYSSPTLALSEELKKDKIAKDDRIGTLHSDHQGTSRQTAERQGADAYYYLRVADNRSKLLVNPALFTSTMIDRAAPRIEEVSLIRDGFILKADPARRTLQRLAQGEYRLAVRLFDPSYAGGVVSGLFRIKVVLDGQVVADRKFDSAQNQDQGLGFLGLPAPSYSLLDRDMRYLLGSRFLARGNHSMELTVYDFNGNAGTFLWRFIVE